MDKIPTAEEFVRKFRKTNPIAEAESIEHWMAQHCIEFTKLHCIAQREAILEKGFVTHKETPIGDEYLIDKESIINAYPLENIK